MKNYKPYSAKIYVLIAILILLLFLSNDGSLITVQKTAIITAVGVDIEDDSSISASVQIAVPEASNTTQENNKTIITGKGSTISSAIQNVGEITGWFPKLSFCNLIIIGEKTLEQNIIQYVDFFSKTLKLQDTAVICACKGEAKKILDEASPLDNISSFAIQKIILKNVGLNDDVASVNIKKFTIGYYSRTNSSFMPFIEAFPADKSKDNKEGESGGDSQDSAGGENQGGGKEKESSENSKKVFDASKTLLFKKGIKTAELTKEETSAYNLFTKTVKDTFFEVNDVEIDGKKTNYTLTIINNKNKLDIKFKDKKPNLIATQKIFCKLDDQTSTDKNENFKSYLYVPKEVLDKAEETLNKSFLSLIEKCRQTDTDIFDIDNIIYKYNQKKYKEFSKNLYDNLNIITNIKFTSAK